MGKKKQGDAGKADLAAAHVLLAATDRRTAWTVVDLSSYSLRFFLLLCSSLFLFFQWFFFSPFMSAASPFFFYF
jgi:hypothetical protein